MIILFIGIILIVGYIRYVESKSVFFPTASIAVTPAEVGLQFVDARFSSKDHVQLHGWLIPTNYGSPTLLFFHGNGGNIADRLFKINNFYKIGANVFIIDYRGYGLSEGKPSEAGIYKDAEAAFDYLLTRKEIDPKKIVAYGASLGGAVAVDLATKRDLAGLIIDSSFNNAASMAKRIMPFVPSFLFKTKLDSAKKIKNMTIPKLFIHSKEDEIVPFELGRKLYEGAPLPKSFLEIRGAHVNLHEEDSEKFFNAIDEFLKGL